MDRYRINVSDATSNFLFSTVRVEVRYPDNSFGSGTAFFFEDFRSSEERFPYLVTNKHVLAGAESIRLRLHVSPSPDMLDFTVSGEYWLEIPHPTSLWTTHPEAGVDLCGISVRRLKDLASGGLSDLFFTSMGSWGIPPADEEKRYPAVMDVVMIGYPTGLWDEVNNLPVIRRGTTASHPAIDFDGRPEVVIDMACFPGSSGSPVAFNDRQYFASAHRFLGVLYAGPEFTNVGEVSVEPVPTRAIVARTPTMIHLGYIIKARKVLELVQHVEAMENGAR